MEPLPRELQDLWRALAEAFLEQSGKNDTYCDEETTNHRTPRGVRVGILSKITYTLTEEPAIGRLARYCMQTIEYMLHGIIMKSNRLKSR